MKKQYLLAKIAIVAALSAATSAVWAGDCNFKGGHYEASTHTLYLESYADTAAEVVFDENTVSCLNQNNPSSMKAVVVRSTPLKANSTIVLPFAARVDDACIALYDVYDFNNKSGTWEAVGYNTMGGASMNQPYIMAVSTNDNNCQDRTEIHFLVNTNSFAATPPGQQLEKWMGNNTGNPGFTLWGTYKYKKWKTGDADIDKVYGYAAKDKGDVSGGQFVKIGGGAYLPPLRAYLGYRGTGLAKKSSDKVEDFELPETINVRLVDGDSTLSVGKLNTVTGEIQMDSRRFDLKGRTIDGKPANHGVYVGKQKVVR